MNKKDFIEIMEEIIKLNKDSDYFNKAFKKLEPDFNFFSFGRFETLVVKTLKKAMNDKYDWIDYWLYDGYYGTNYKILNSVKDKNGKKIPLKTLSNLYNCIKHNE